MFNFAVVFIYPSPHLYISIRISPSPHLPCRLHLPRYLYLPLLYYKENITKNSNWRRSIRCVLPIHGDIEKKMRSTWRKLKYTLKSKTTAKFKD
jgi:hypothetical protein